MASTVGIVAVCVTLLLALVFPALARVYVLDDAAETTSRDHVTGPKRGSTKYRDTLKGHEMFESRRTSPPRSSRRVTTTTTTTTRVPTTSPQANTTTTTTAAGTTDNDYAVTTDDEASQGHEDSTTTAMTQTPDTITTITTTTNRAHQQGYEVHETGDDVLDSYVRQVLGLDEHSETPRGEEEAAHNQENYLGSPSAIDHDNVDAVQTLVNSPDKALTVAHGSNLAQQAHWQVGSVANVRDKDNNVQALSGSPNEALAATQISYHGQQGEISVPWQGNHQVGSSTAPSGQDTVQELGRLPDEASKGRNLAQHHDHWQGDRQMVSESGSEGNDDVHGLSTSPDEALLAIPMSYQAQQGHVSITRHENHRSSSTANALQRGEVQDLGSLHDEALKGTHRSNHAQHHQEYDHWEGDRQVGSGSGAEDKDEVQALSSSADDALAETQKYHQAERGQVSMPWQEEHRVGSAADAVDQDNVQHQGRSPDEFLTASQSSYRAQADQASMYWQRNREARLVSGGEDDNNVVEVHVSSSSPQRPHFSNPHAQDGQASTHWLRDTAVGSGAGADGVQEEEVEALGSSSDPVLTAPETPYRAQVDQVSIRWHLDPQRAAQQADPSASHSGSTLADVSRIDASFPHYLTSSTSTTETPLPVSYHSQQQRAPESRHFRPTMIKFTLEDRMIPPPGSYLGGGEDVLGDDGGDGGRRGRQLDLQTERTLAPEFLSIGYGGDVSQDSGLGTSRNPVKFSVDSGAAEVVHSAVVKKGRDPDLTNEVSQLNAVYGHQQLLWVTTAAPTTPAATSRAPPAPPPAPVTTAVPLPARTTTTLRPPVVAVVRPEDQQFSMSSTVHGSIKFAPPSQDNAVAKSPGRLRPRQLHNVVYGSPVAAPPSSSAFVVVPARHPVQLQGPYYHHHQHQQRHGVRSQRRVPVLWASAR